MPVLHASWLHDVFSLQVDASKHGVERPVAFFKRKINKYQLNYSVIENEALALIWALLLFDVYLGHGATSLIVYTDHNPLTFLQSSENPNQCLMQWALF